MDFTRRRRKSHIRAGSTNGAMKPPLAPSTWIGTSRPLSAWSVSSAAATSATGSYWHVKVTPSVGTTPMVFSSTRLSTFRVHEQAVTLHRDLPVLECSMSNFVFSSISVEARVVTDVIAASPPADPKVRGRA